uniref:Moubatin-like 5 n=1 Tax=Ornithodoros parkeri TaxID=140564 RepID=A6N9X4_ORNPR|nr:moubatin-like 5 [Ornithodoros parkeri]
MLQLVAFIAGCCIVATAKTTCQQGPVDARKSIVGPGTGKLYLVKSTCQQDICCLYTIPPPTGTPWPAPYPFGYKNKATGEWVKVTTGTVNGEGANVIDSDSGFGETNTTLLYSDYQNCAVGLFHGGKVTGGPHLELFKYSSAADDSQALQCCEQRFAAELEKQGKTATDVIEVNKDCDYPE